MKPEDAAIYDRARRLANLAVWTVELQCRRIKTSEPEDGEFIFRRWADIHFLIVALTRLRRAAVLASKIETLKANISEAIHMFDDSLPNLKQMRDVAEHIDDYATNKGKNKNVDRSSLEVFVHDSQAVHWLGFSLDIGGASNAASTLFGAIVNAKDRFVEQNA
jgi:hypothetical protein